MSTRRFVRDDDSIYPFLESILMITNTIQNGMHSFHQRWLDVVEGYRLLRAMIQAPLAVNAIQGVPVLVHIRWGAVGQMMARLEWHISLASFLVLGVIRQNTGFPQTSGHQNVLAEGVQMRHAGWHGQDESFQSCLVEGVSRAARIKDAVHVAIFGKASTKEERSLQRLISIGKIYSAIRGRLYFF